MANSDKHTPHMLSGVRVLDFTQYLAGPTVTRFMAEMGAEIVKVEQAPMGDPARLLPAVRNGRSAYFVQQNRGKQSLCLDFSKPESIALLRDLAKKADVVVENYGPGVMEKRGLDYASLSKLNPRVIMASISAFGRTGPLSHKVGYDFIAQAFSGLMHMTGDPNGPPMFVGMGIGDQSSGVHAFSAIGFALFHRERTGVGQYIDIAMVDSLYHMHEVNIQVWATTKGEYVPKRMGSQHELVSPCGSFKGPEGYIVVLVLDRQWPSMARAMARPELIEDPRFATMRDRAKNRYELAAIVEAWMQGRRHGESSALQGPQHDSHRARPDPGRGDDSRLSAQVFGLPQAAGNQGAAFGRARGRYPARSTRHERRQDRRTAEPGRAAFGEQVAPTSERDALPARSFDICRGLAKVVES